MTSTGVRIVKVGGSLFCWRDLPHAIRRWLGRQTPMHNVLLAGGGEFADVVRSADQRFALGQQASHWICVDLLRATSRLLASLLPEAELTTHWPDLSRRLQGDSEMGLFVLDPVQFLKDIEPSNPGIKLPCSWDATSDSIAARVAASLRADDFVLLKSAMQNRLASSRSLVEKGIVDKFFPHASTTIDLIRIVNLRSPDFDEVSFRTADKSIPK